METITKIKCEDCGVVVPMPIEFNDSSSWSGSCYKCGSGKLTTFKSVVVGEQGSDENS